jgi:hypothetical protein
MQVLDLFLSNYHWYRRVRGGLWWQVEIPLLDGSQIPWVHQMPECECCIIEEYQ